jgi:hypothetical protein
MQTSASEAFAPRDQIFALAQMNELHRNPTIRLLKQISKVEHHQPKLGWAVS